MISIASHRDLGSILACPVSEIIMEQKRNILYHNGIISKISIIFIGVTLTPMILITGIFLYRFNTFSIKMVHAHLEESVLRHKYQIDFFLEEKLRDIRHLSHYFEMEPFGNDTFLRERLQDLQAEYNTDFVALELIDEQGHQVAYAGPQGLEHAYYKSTDWFKKAFETRYYISDIFMGPNAQPQCVVATKIQQEDSRWILKATIDFSPVGLMLETFKSGNSGTAFILNRKGEFQISRSKNFTLTQSQYLNLFKKEKYIGKVDNNKLLLVSALLKNDDWLLVFQQDTGDAFSELKVIRNVVALVFLLSAMGVIMISFWLSGRIKKHIVQVDPAKNMVNRQIVENGNLASIGELATGIAHEINNPVAIMVEEAGWIQDLLHEGIDNKDNLEEFIRALKQIEAQGRRCKGITQKLLSFGRKTDSKIQSVQLNELIEEVVSLSSEKARHGKVTIHTRLDPHLPEIRASVIEMHQVLLNIVNNALDALEKKGDRIEISSTLRDNQIIITVADNGPGIPSTIMNRLFDPFFSTKPVGKGSGLGLSQCYGIVKKMGGRIDVESMAGEGAMFSIMLPFDDHFE